MRLPVYTWRFKRVHLLMDGGNFRTHFEDGTVKEQDFLVEVQREDNWHQSWANGYGHDYLRYYQEHDFVHHWLAERLHDDISMAIRHGDPDVGVSNAPTEIRYEELLVHRVQQTVRLGGDSEWLTSWEGVDGFKLISDLEDDLVKCFGTFEIYPGANAVYYHERYFEEVHNKESRVRTRVMQP